VEMTTKNDGGPAFPIPASFSDDRLIHHQEYGMTLRDYFAAKALQGICDTWGLSSSDIARMWTV